METERLASLKLGAVGLPVEIRVLRKWNPRFRKFSTCYIFVDRFGDAIQEIAHGSIDQKFMESIIKQNSCYRIEGYVCAEPNIHFNALSHPVNMRIGAASSITPIPDTSDLPVQYFNFCNRATLDNLSDNEEIIIDYYGILQGFEDRSKKDNSPYLILTLLDASDQDTKATLWEEISTSKERFDRQLIQNADRPAVIVVTAMKASHFSGKPRLNSTFGTFVYLNPNDRQTKELLNRHRDRNDSFTGIQDPITASDKNTTIITILQKQNSELTGETFTCDATIIQILPTIDWYLNLCPICSYEIFPSGQTWYCPTHGRFDNAKHTYHISAIISDDTAAITATILHEAVTIMVGIECSDLRIQDACETNLEMPAPIQSLRGRKIRFQIQAQRNARSDTVRASIKKDTEPSQQAYPTTTKPSTVGTPVPTTPKTTPPQPTTSRRLNFDTPESESSSSKKRRQ